MEQILYYDAEMGEFQTNYSTINERNRWHINETEFNIMERCSSSIDLLQNMIKSEASGALQIAWTLFIKELKDDVDCSERRIKELERNIAIKVRNLEENGLAFEELQSQLSAEHNKIMVQEKARFNRIVSNLRSRLEECENELYEQMEFKRELLDRFNTIFRQKKRSQIKKAALLKENEDLLHEMELQQDVIDHLKKALNDCKDEIEREAEKRYKEGVRMGRELASIEEIGILEELQMLRDIQTTLELDVRQNEMNRLEKDYDNIVKTVI